MGMSFRERFDKHSLQHLRESLEKANRRAPSLIPTLQNHQAYLRASISVLLDDSVTPDEKIAALRRFIPVLRMHTRAEEETLYARLLRDDSKEARVSGMTGQDEHDIAGYLTDELESLRFAGNWSEALDAKAKVLASAVNAHLSAESRILYPLVRRHFGSDELHALGEAYVEKCRNFLEEDLSPFTLPTRNPPLISRGLN